MTKHYEFDKNFKLRLVCEHCGFEINELLIVDNFMICKECFEAEQRRNKLKQSEKEWEMQ